MWFRLMMIAMIFNGFGDFGIRLLQYHGNAKEHTAQYLVGWYGTGAIGAIIAMIRTRKWPTKSDWGVGMCLGICSFVGQIMIGKALVDGLPGAVIYPISKTGGIFLVAIAGVILFRERLGIYGIIGIILGLFGVCMLSLEGS
jgi:drug/metabolite transporter (DMT)-like permease